MTLEIHDALFRCRKVGRGRAWHSPARVCQRSSLGEVEDDISGQTLDETYREVKHLHKERRKIEKRIEGAFEQIDKELWGVISSIRG